MDIWHTRRIETPRLVIRAFEPADAEALWAGVEESRATLEPWLPWVAGYESIDDAVRTIERFQAVWADRDDLPFGVFHRETGELLGGTGLHRIDWEALRFEIGYWLRESHERHGYMTECVAALARTALREFDARRIEIRMDPHNVRSRGIPVRLGFRSEGTHIEDTMGFAGLPKRYDRYALEPGDDLALIEQATGAPR
ncbi:MAG: GCN5-related N-acetyltransferase [Thermoleophilia bacterium]|nr:GCN5-related N-acetyltransferase [Thermoleophilia bacterium]